MKPHEEMWTVQDLESECRGTFGSCSLPILELTPERLQLAAQAPAMARLLEELLHEYKHGYQSGNPFNEIERVLRDAGVI